MVKSFENNSILTQFMSELRDVNTQTDSMRFRRNIERIGEIMAYEISKNLSFTNKKVQTPLGQTKVPVIKDEIVLAAVLRAGLPPHRGLFNYFDTAENAFISAYRKYENSTDFDIHIEYLTSPTLDNKTLIIADPMLATGSSMVLAYQAVLKNGTPKHTHLVSVIGSTEGVEFVKNELKGKPVSLWIAAVDDSLDSKKYIVPGLGDAGDLAFGEKLDSH